MTMESAVVAQELHALIQMLDPAHWRADLESAARESALKLKLRVQQLLAQPAQAEDDLHDSLSQVAEQLEDGSKKRDWRGLFERLQPLYEAVARVLRAEKIRVPALRQTNYRRSLVHVCLGFFALSCITLFDMSVNRWIVSVWLTFAVTMEAGRRLSPTLNKKLMKGFGPIAHPHEYHQMNSASWYVFAISLLAWTVEPYMVAVGVMVLGLADPAAAAIGRKWGTHKIVGGRSLEGSATFVLVGTIVGLVVMTTIYSMAWTAALPLAFAGALVGAIAELYTPTFSDDNFTIPVAVAYALLLLG